MLTVRRCMLLLLIATLVSGSFLSSGYSDGKAYAAESAEPAVLQQWNFDADAEGWTALAGWSPAASLADYHWSDGGSVDGSFAAGDDTPRLHSPNNLGDDFSHYANVKLIIRYRNGSDATSANFYWRGAGDPTWLGQKGIRFNINANDANYTDYTLNLSQNPNFDGTLTQLRIDLSATAGKAGSFSVDSIRLVGEPIAAAGLRIDQTNAVVKVGHTATVTGSVYDQSGNPLEDAPIAWSSDDPSIATVNDGGVITGVALGSTTVKAISGALTASVRVIVSDSIVRLWDFDRSTEGWTALAGWSPAAPIADFQWTEGGYATGSFGAGDDTPRLQSPAGAPLDYTHYANVKLIVRFRNSSDSAIVHLYWMGVGDPTWQGQKGIQLPAVPNDPDYTDYVFPLSQNQYFDGKIAQMRFDFASGTGKSGSFGVDSIRVEGEERVPTRVAIDQASVAVNVGKSAAVNGYVVDQQANPIPYLPVAWTSDDPAVATVDGSGVVTGRALGTTVVRATYGDFSASVYVVVTNQSLNRPPLLANTAFSTDRGAAYTGIVQATDPDGDSLTYAAATEPAHGMLSLGADGHFTYTPADGSYTGYDSFKVEADDGAGGTATADAVMYMGPTQADIAADLAAHNPDARHPRLLATEDDFDREKSLLDTDPFMQRMYETVKTTADALLGMPLIDYGSNTPPADGIDFNNRYTAMLNGGAELQNRSIQLGFMYRMTGEAKYAQRLWQELEKVSAQNDWLTFNPFLDPKYYSPLQAATVSAGAAIGYDWIYDYLSGEQRATVRDALVSKVLEPAIRLYDGGAYWVTDGINQNMWNNGGFALAAIAVGDEEPAKASRVLYEALQGMPYGLIELSPDGAWAEGSAYWGTIARYQSWFFASLDAAFGQDYGIANEPWISETSLFPAYISGSNGQFNYADAFDDPTPQNEPVFFWMASKFGEPGYAWYHKQDIESTGRVSPLDLIWYRPDMIGSAPESLDKLLQVNNFFDVAGLHGGWNPQDATFVGLKSGNNSQFHGQLDIGDFVFDALGVRWAIDYGRGDYNGMIAGRDWEYYRNRAEGQNTIVINPGKAPDQDLDAISRITAYDSKPGGAYAVMDMSQAYKTNALSVKRGFMLTDQRQNLLVQDEIKTIQPSDLYWFMQTRAKIDIQPDGKTAILSSAGKRLWVKLLSPSNGSFEDLPAEQLPSTYSPPPPGESDNGEAHKLAIHLTGAGDTTLAVWMVPLQPGEAAPTALPAVEPLADWSVDETPTAELSGITVDGKPLPSFEPGTFNYEYRPETNGFGAPTIEAAPASGGYDYQVAYPDELPGTAFIDVTDRSGHAKAARYAVYLDTTLAAKSVTANDYDAANPPQSTIDGNINTRWSSSGDPRWLTYDFGGQVELSGISIARWNGDFRKYGFEIELSDDGETWHQVYAGISSGTTLDYETYDFPAEAARYLRIVGHGSDVSAYNHVSEVKFLGHPLDETAPATQASVRPASPDGRNGWYTHAVTVILSAEGGESGVAATAYSLDGGHSWKTYRNPLRIDQDGEHAMQYRSTDKEGNMEPAKSLAVKLDGTAPTIAAIGLRPDTYGDAADIKPVITVSDRMSGVDKERTAITLDGHPYRSGTTTALYTLPLGPHKLVATAFDKAGNKSVATIAFRTAASLSSLKSLVARFGDNHRIDNGGIENSLQQKLKHGDIQGFIRLVQAQSGKHIAKTAAGYLLRDAQAVKPGH